MAEFLVNSAQNPDQEGQRNELLSDDLKSSITSMMTVMMFTFKDELLWEFEGYFSSADLRSGQETVTTDTSVGQECCPNYASVSDAYFTAKPNDSSVSSPLPDLVMEFVTTDKTGPAIDKKLTLTGLVNGLCEDQLPRAKLEEVIREISSPREPSKS